jgi:hypothetical protein
MRVIKNNLINFNNTHVTIGECAIDKNRSAQIDANKTAFYKTAVFIFANRKWLNLKIDLLKLLVFG